VGGVLWAGEPKKEKGANVLSEVVNDFSGWISSEKPKFVCTANRRHTPVELGVGVGKTEQGFPLNSL
jgi:hypothetical protein